eukprot:2614462-Lingulodinium_polyedra.AAC.1
MSLHQQARCSTSANGPERQRTGARPSIWRIGQRPPPRGLAPSCHAARGATPPWAGAGSLARMASTTLPASARRPRLQAA